MYRSSPLDDAEGHGMTSTISEITVLQLTVWLNAWRSGHITAFDAANACESITTSLDVMLDGDRHPWIDLLAYCGPNAVPFRAVLPEPGNPDGVPVETLQHFNQAAGLIVMDNKIVIGPNAGLNWIAITRNLAPLTFDVQYARIALLKTIADAQESLKQLDLVGSRITADKALQEINFGHLPPSTPKRTSDSLDLALKILTLARIAQADSTAIASRSQDHERSRLLLNLEQQARHLLQAAASAAHS